MVSSRRSGPRRAALVTGDAGFLGRHFRRALDDAGWTTTGLDVARSAAGDVRELFKSELGGYGLVVHCAAVEPHREAIDRRPLVVAENLELDAALFRWAARTRPDRVLYLSSSAVYPVSLQDGSPRWLLAERFAGPAPMMGMPDQVYGWAKLTGERLAGELAAGGVPVTVVRPFSGYGSDQSSAYPFGAFITRALQHADPFPVWGDGRQVRDFVHVDDLVRCALAACAQGIAGPLNICTGQPTSLDELARLVCKVAGYQPTLKRQTHKPAGVRWRVGDPAQMLDVWRPTVELEDGIRRALSERAAVSG